MLRQAVVGTVQFVGLNNMNYALIKNNLVEAIIVADSEFAASITSQWDAVVLVTGDAGVGWSYIGGIFIAPPVVIPPPPDPIPEPPRYLSKLGFRNRFTMAEKAALEIASLDNPAASMQQRMIAATLRASLADQRDATYIDPTRTDTRAGVTQLETYGIIAAGRALEILDAPILDNERYYGNRYEV